MVCTGNQCRSPLAAALLAARLPGRHCGVTVSSAGFTSPGRPVPAVLTKVAADLPVDLAGHRSRQLSGPLLADAGLVVVMTRQHLLDLVVDHPDVWPRAFTLADVVRRSREVGPRRMGQAGEGWVAELHARRVRADVLAAPAEDDVADPIGGRRGAFVRMRTDVERLVGALADALCPPGGGAPA